MAAFIVVSSGGVLLQNESKRVGVYVPVVAPFLLYASACLFNK